MKNNNNNRKKRPTNQAKPKKTSKTTQAQISNGSPWQSCNYVSCQSVPYTTESKKRYYEMSLLSIKIYCSP